MLNFLYFLTLVSSLNPGDVYQLTISDCTVIFIIGSNNEATDGLDSFTAISNPNSITSFYLPETISLNGETVTFVGIYREAFKDHIFTQILLPKSITSIGVSTFESCLVEEIDLFNTGITEIPEKSFFNCQKLQEIRFPQNTTLIGVSAFESCSSLATAYLDESTVDTISQNAFASCEGLLTVEFPQTLQSLGDSCFEGCINLSSISLDNTEINTIGNRCFMDCQSLMQAHFYETEITVIPESCFVNCGSLDEITLPKNLLEIQSNAFTLSGIQQMELPSSLTTIAMRGLAFMTSLKSLNLINTNVSELSNLCFQYSGLETIFLSQKLGESTFSQCSNLKEVVFSKLITKIPNSCFSDCVSLTTIQFNENPEETVKIFSPLWLCDLSQFTGAVYDSNCFSGCSSLKSVLFGNLSQISNDMFNGCTSLLNVSLFGSEIATIDAELFSSCTNLNYLFLPDSVNTISISFVPTNNLSIIIMLAQSNIEFNGDPTHIIFQSNNINALLGDISAQYIDEDIVLPSEIFNTEESSEISSDDFTPERTYANNGFTPDFRYPPENKKIWLIVFAVLLGLLILAIIVFMIFSCILTCIKQRNFGKSQSTREIFEV